MKTAFSLDQQLESINNGAARYDISQMYPISGNITDAYVGSNGASGITTFQWQDSVGWWSPYNSYFLLQLEFSRSGTAGIPAANNVTYCDNFAQTLFTQVQTQINSQPVDTIFVPHIIDTVLSYTKGHNNFLKTFGSLTRLGESLTTRLRNVKLAADGGSAGLIDVVFRPPVSVFDCKLLPPGPQFRIDFNWASSAALAFESVDGSITIGTASGNYNIKVKGFSFFKAIVQPGVETPDQGIIELCPAVANQYFLNSGKQLRQNITMPGSTNKIYIAFQDLNARTVTTSPPVDNVDGVGNGYQPATSFTHRFTTGTALNQTFTSNTTTLQQLWLDLPELGITEPKPVYNFGSGTDDTDLLRAYSDFCHITQGTHDQAEGSIPFGNYTVNKGTTIITVNAAATYDAGPPITVTNTGLTQLGDPNNPQEFPYYAITASTADANTYNQTARWGWAGRCPGPIFAFPVVRPGRKLISTGTLNLTTVDNVQNISVTQVSCYSMVIAVVKQSNGLYAYTMSIAA